MEHADHVTVRLYGDLAQLAGADELDVGIVAARSVKDLVESLGVPHTELGALVVDTEPVTFDHLVRGGERVAAYPPLGELDPDGVVALVTDPPERFVLDVHLGALTRRLRLLGLDCWYRNDADDLELVEIATGEQRVLLTRDRELLMRRDIVHGYCPRSDDPVVQALEVVRRFGLAGRLAPFTRCARCNGPLEATTAVDDVPARTRAFVSSYARCGSCGQVYWRGAHAEALDAFVARVRRV